MARATHIAVNLLLIVVVTMEPGLACGLQQDCSAGNSSGFTCQGCGGCKVQSETANCPCCRVEATKEEGGCCGHGHQNRDRIHSFADDSFDGMELQEGQVLSDSVPRDKDDLQVQVTNEVSLAAACHCVTAPSPFDAPVPRSPATELRDTVTINIAFADVFATSAEPPLSRSFEFARSPIEPHFSQIAFCVWRL